MWTRNWTRNWTTMLLLQRRGHAGLHGERTKSIQAQLLPTIARRLYRDRTPELRRPSSTSSLSFQRFSSFWNPQTTTYALLGINSAVFLAWQVAKYRQERNRDPQLYAWMRQHFTLDHTLLWSSDQRDQRSGWQRWAGSAHTLLTNQFSQSDLRHFAFNMIGVYSFAPVVCAQVGSIGAFLALYLGGGLACNIASMLYSRWFHQPQQRQRWSFTGEERGHGASGCLNAVLTQFAFANPWSQILIFGLVPAPAIACWAGFAFADYFYMASGSRTNHVGHLGGLVAGAVFYAAYFRRMRRLPSRRGW